eukprot:gene9911-biopygen7635
MCAFAGVPYSPQNTCSLQDRGHPHEAVDSLREAGEDCLRRRRRAQEDPGSVGAQVDCNQIPPWIDDDNSATPKQAADDATRDAEPEALDSATMAKLALMMTSGTGTGVGLDPREREMAHVVLRGVRGTRRPRAHVRQEEAGCSQDTAQEADVPLPEPPEHRPPHGIVQQSSL